MDNLKKLIEVLARCGIRLPQDTTADNLGDRLYVAATAVAGQRDGGAGGDVPEPAYDATGAQGFATRAAGRGAAKRPAAAPRLTGWQKEYQRLSQLNRSREAANELARSGGLPLRGEDGAVAPSGGTWVAVEPAGRAGQ